MQKKTKILIIISIVILISCKIFADSKDSNLITITPTYTQAELDSMRSYFIKYGSEETYFDYLFYGTDRKNEYIFTFYMANTFNTSGAQLNMYEIIKYFYQSIGEELDSTANAIALSYLKRSVEQGHYFAVCEISELLLCGIGMPKDTIKAKEYLFKYINHVEAEKLWIINNESSQKWFKIDVRKREKIREKRKTMLQTMEDKGFADEVSKMYTYTPEALEFLKNYFILHGDEDAYIKYINFCPDVENKAMYTFYMANTHNSAIAQYQMYCMIRDFYASIGKEMDSTASAIALSYLRRSAVQGNADAIQEMQKLGKKVPYIFWHPYKKMHLEW